MGRREPEGGRYGRWKVGGGRHGILDLGRLDGLIHLNGGRMDSGQWRGRAGRRGGHSGSECEWLSELDLIGVVRLLVTTGARSESENEGARSDWGDERGRQRPTGYQSD